MSVAKRIISDVNIVGHSPAQNERIQNEKEVGKAIHIIDHRGQRRPMSQHLKSRWEPEDRTWLMVVLPYYPAIPPPRPQTLSGQKSNDFFTTSIVSDRMAIAVDDLWSSH